MARTSARKSAKKTGGKGAAARKKAAQAKTTPKRKKAKVVGGKSRKSRKVPKKAPARRRAGAPEPILVPVGLVTTSFRLPPDLLGRLRLMATHRRNRLARPYSQSSIVEQAIGEWLERNGP